MEVDDSLALSCGLLGMFFCVLAMKEVEPCGVLILLSCLEGRFSCFANMLDELLIAHLFDKLSLAFSLFEC